MNALAKNVIGLVRPRVPTVLVPLMVPVQAAIDLRSPSRRDDARAQMAFLLEQSRPAADLDRAARGYAYGMRLRGERCFHESMVPHPVEGAEDLLAIVRSGRGAVVNFCHHGLYDTMVVSLRALGLPVHVMLSPQFFEADAPAHLQQRLRNLREVEAVPHSATVGTAGVVDALRRGAVFLVASDVPGRSRVTMFGRELFGSSGAAWAATTTDSPVVPLTSRGPERPRVHLGTPLEPRDYASVDLLLAEMLRQQEEAILAWPEAADTPLERWGPADV